MLSSPWQGSLRGRNPCPGPIGDKCELPRARPSDSNHASSLRWSVLGPRRRITCPRRSPTRERRIRHEAATCSRPALHVVLMSRPETGPASRRPDCPRPWSLRLRLPGIGRSDGRAGDDIAIVAASRATFKVNPGRTSRSRPATGAPTSAIGILVPYTSTWSLGLGAPDIKLGTRRQSVDGLFLRDVPRQNPISLSARPLRAGTFHLALILTRNGDFFEKQMDRRRDGNGDQCSN